MIDTQADPGIPDRRSGPRYLGWLVREQLGRSLVGALISSVWTALLAVAPYLMSRAIDDGLVTGDLGALSLWVGALLAAGLAGAGLGVMRHRIMTRVRMDANFRTVKVVVGHAVRLGAALRRRVSAGEVVTIGVGDVATIGASLTVVGPGTGAVVAYLVVAALLIPLSGQLAALVLLGLPLIGLVVGPLLGRLLGSETEYRERQSKLTARIGDIAAGLRVLNGLGGKGIVADAFRRDSGRLREQGYRVGSTTSWVQALGVGAPALFVAVVSWLAARQAAGGAITVGELVAVYGYVAVLVGPVSFLIETGYMLSRGLVAARRVVAFLGIEPEPDRGRLDAPTGPAELHDPTSGVRIPPGRFTALAGSRSADAVAVVDRLGRYAPSEATWGGVRLDEVPLARVRERVLVADADADIFAGTFHEVLDSAFAGIGRQDAPPWDAGVRPVAGKHEGAENPVDVPAGAQDAVKPGTPPASHRTRAVHAAAADDIVRGLPDGPDSAVDAGGGNLSGGQRQRLRLARALAADPEVLLAVEPTSALDAHTEATVARRLREIRTGRTTVVTTTSPLVLDRADSVHYLVDGRVAATGTHRELLTTEPGYRALIEREGTDRTEEGVS
ncbi:MULTISPECIES: ABC transporter transmembrane domain-containing protein [unclassified Streptomyces]|uniref:ABC transporter transmembrane domain-containing protein n=1 Tax=unclassified Streptomyces TaxID=2593676 RepID=UPI0019045DC2|nr:ABC transporter ATP-binding protein [Streptomyces sp. HSG2]